MSENNKDTTFVFRLQNDNKQHGLSNTIKHWDDSCMFDDKQINAVESTNKNSFHQPTSIPSPFARIALVKTAFGEVAEHGGNALASYQKIVSDSLDVAEIFFTFDKWKDKIEVIKWDKEKDLQKLSAHKHLYKTLNTFLLDDAQSYNFDKMECIYILKYKATGEMIGATSPCTLFFSSANELVDENGELFLIDKEKNKKTFGAIQLSNNHKAFTGIFPLHSRSWDFQKYLYTWVKANNENRTDGNTPVSIFNEFVKYLDSQKQLSGRIQEINDLIVDFGSYEIFPAETPVEVCGKKFHKLNKNITIESLTESDLMEDKIISLPYEINKESFFDGNMTNGRCYILPLKEKFFEYFTSKDLEKLIKIEGGQSTAKVILDLPVNGHTKKFEKEYRKSEMTLIEKSLFDCSIFPNVEFKEENNAFYRVGLYLPFSEKEIESNIDFYQGTSRVILDEVESIIRNTNDTENSICKTYSLNQKTFDRMRVNIGEVTGILIPTLSEKQNTDVFTFAVDFGTTNTHIEYKTSSHNTIKPFDIKESEKQIQFLHGKIEENTLVSDIDLIPGKIGRDEKFKFPVRTALALSKNRQKDKTIFPFVQSNIIIPYEKRQIPKYNEVITQLKWDSTEEEMGYFIETLCLMMRNKVVLNDGKLSTTQIVWFYPLSMAGSRSRIIADKWKLSYAKYFLGISVNSINDLEESVKNILKENIKELPESVAPFLCYKDDQQYRDAINNLVSIDIGGGTTDVVFVIDKKVEYVTSFRFAANSIFGLGEHIRLIVSKYQNSIEKIIEENDTNFKLKNILTSISGQINGDIASFFFSLSDNEMMKNVKINFNTMLEKDKDQKIVFVLFYSAIIYHSAQIMKAKKLPLPRHITFSGNGSRILNIIADKEVLTEFTKLIFEKVYGIDYGESGLDIIQNTINPKEVTCKGGIRAADKDYIQTPFESVVLLGTNENEFASAKDTYSTIQIDNCISQTNASVKAFIQYVTDDLLTQNFTKGVVLEPFIQAMKINQKTLQNVKDVCSRDEDLNTFIKNGITGKMESIKDASSTKIEETFFFYPIASLLNSISNEINNMN